MTDQLCAEWWGERGWSKDASAAYQFCSEHDARMYTVGRYLRHRWTVTEHIFDGGEQQRLPPVWLIERLEATPSVDRGDVGELFNRLNSFTTCGCCDDDWPQLRHDLADTITALQAQVASLEAALRGNT